jgi:hypothetical protein
MSPVVISEMPTQTSNMRALIDSSVCVDVARGNLKPEDWRALRETIQRKFAYFVSPLTFIELVSGLGKGDEGYYQRNLEALKILLEPGERFLQFPNRFVLDRVLGIVKEHPGFEPTDFSTWATVLLNAATKKQLADGNVDLMDLSRDATFGFDFTKIIKPLEEGITNHVAIYEGIRNRKEPCPTRQQWADAFLVANGLPLTQTNRQVMLERIDAAITLASHLCELARTTDYKFEKHKGDWIDDQHLYYLADPEIHIITMDKPLKDRIKSSSQARRVLTPEEVLAT